MSTTPSSAFGTFSPASGGEGLSRNMAEQASRLLSTALVARAAGLARKGRYDAAESLLNDALQGERSIEALDLLARIRAQQGRLAEAESLWNEVLARDVTLESAQAALRRIHAMQTRRVALWPFAIAAVMIIAVLAIGLQRDASPATTVAPARVLARPATTLAPDRSTALALLSIPGVAVHEHEGDFVATFEAGLFSHGVTLTSEARPLLAQFGHLIERHASRAHVIIEGHCDRLPLRDRSVYRDDFDLGLARAGTVFHYLKQTTDLPASAFSLRSAGSDAQPFAESGLKGESRNRSVVIRIRP